MSPSPAGPGNGSGERAPPDLNADERRRLAAGEAGALERFYDLYFDRVYAYVRRLVREEHLAEDVTQDVFMHVYRSLESYDPERELRPWVYTIATNKVRDHWRSRRHREAQQEVSAHGEDGEWEAAPPVSPGRGPAERVVAGELSEQVAEAIADMPEVMRTTLVLRYYEGLSFAEIGGMVDRNETAVRKRYSRALEELRNRLAHVAGKEEG